MNHRLAFKEIKASFDVSNVYIGALVGPQLVAGTYAVFYFLQTGVWSLILPFIAVGIIGLLCFFAAEIARRYQLYEYGAFARKIYGNNKVLCFIFDIYIIGTLLSGVASYLAMAGTFMNELLGVTPFVGMLILSIIPILLTSFKDSLVRTAGSVMSIVMFAGFIVLLILIITIYGPELKTAITSWYVPEGASALTAVKNISVFGFCSSAMAVTLCCVEQPIRKRKQSWWIMIFTTVIGGLMMMLNCMYLLPFMPEIMGVEVPLIHIMKHYLSVHVPWLSTVYYLIMLIAVVSSIVPNIYMVSSRLITFVNPQKREKHSARYLFLFGIVFMAVGVAVASFGLSAILTYGFSFVAYAGIPLVCIPICIIYPVKFYRERKSRDMEKNTV